MHIATRASHADQLIVVCELRGIVAGIVRGIDFGSARIRHRHRTTTGQGGALGDVRVHQVGVDHGGLRVDTERAKVAIVAATAPLRRNLRLERRARGYRVREPDIARDRRAAIVAHGRRHLVGRRAAVYTGDGHGCAVADCGIGQRQIFGARAGTIVPGVGLFGVAVRFGDRCRCAKGADLVRCDGADRDAGRGTASHVAHATVERAATC